jgi:hypothetical protein
LAARASLAEIERLIGTHFDPDVVVAVGGLDLGELAHQATTVELVA